MSVETLRNWKVDQEWTLFLDRDGVINRRLPDEYVTKWAEFEFLPNALAALSRLAKQFGVIVIVTNQRGIGSGLMTETDLADVHGKMLETIRQSGGRIDGIYYCPHDHIARCDCRKPAIGLALRAKGDFPSVDFMRSIMVGDSASDMDFAQNARLHKVWVGPASEKACAAPDFTYSSLDEFSLCLENSNA